MSIDTSQAMMDVADVWRQVLEVASGERQAALEAGYSETAAEAVALTVYASMAQVITATMVAQVTAAEAVTPPS